MLFANALEYILGNNTLNLFTYCKNKWYYFYYTYNNYKRNKLLYIWAKTKQFDYDVLISQNENKCTNDFF